MAGNNKKHKNKQDPYATGGTGGVSIDDGSGDAGSSGSSGGYLGGPYAAPDPHQDWTWGGDSIRAPRYYDGAQDEPYGWSDPDQVGGLQMSLIAAGLLSRKSIYALGMWDPDSASAYKKALTWANKLGVPVETLFEQLMAGADLGGGGGGGGSLGPQPATDEDIMALANKVAQGTLGRDLRPEEAANFLPAFRNVEFSGTSPSVSAENIVRHDTAPAEAYAHDVGGVMQTVTKLLGG